MKQIVAYIRPNKLDATITRLEKIDHRGITYSAVRGYGKQKGQTELNAAENYSVKFLPKTRITIVLDEPVVEEALNAILESNRSGRIGDGKILVLPCAETH